MRIRLLFLLASLVLAACQSVPSNSMTEEDRVLAAEDDYVVAEVGRDEEALRRFVDDKFIRNISNGTTFSKEDFIRAVMKLRMAGQEIRERTVHVEGDVALVFGTADIRFVQPDKTEAHGSFRYTSTYVKRGGQWRLLALQMQPRTPR